MQLSPSCHRILRLPLLPPEMPALKVSLGILSGDVVWDLPPPQPQWWLKWQCWVPQGPLVGLGRQELHCSYL